MKKKQYHVEVITEGAIGAILLGASKLPIKKMIDVMNRYGNEGWSVNFMVIEEHRFWLFWKREAAIITFEYEYE